MVTRRDVEQKLTSVGDYVRIDYLSGLLKESLDFDTRKFVLVKLSGLYEMKSMFLEGAKLMRGAAEINVTFSGLYGKENGIDAYFKMLRLKKSVKNLPEIFQSQGYFTACDVLTEKIIPNRGFDIHQTHNEYEDDLTIKHPNFIKHCIEKANDKPLFLFLYFSKIHTVTVSEVLKKYDWDDKKFYDNKEENLKIYDTAFKEVGNYAKLITNELEKLQLKDNTILIFFFRSWHRDWRKIWRKKLWFIYL